MAKASDFEGKKQDELFYRNMACLADRLVRCYGYIHILLPSGHKECRRLTYAPHNDTINMNMNMFRV